MPWVGHRIILGQRGRNDHVVIACGCGWQRDPDLARTAQQLWHEHLGKERAVFRHSLDALDDIEVHMGGGQAHLACACGWRISAQGAEGPELAQRIYEAKRTHASTGA
jgi:hypothetical protein